jgi:adenylyltransferase/sulfurtransferase
MELTTTEYQRYARHIALPTVGVAGQLLLKAARVLVVGTGGLGSPVALYLAAAGVGTLGIVDDDVVDISNLQRQIIHTTADIGVPKVNSATAHLRALNPDITVVPIATRVDADNVLALIADYSIVVDATDSFATRYVLNDACVRSAKILVSGAIFRFEGQVSVYAPHRGGPCYRCLFPTPPSAELAPNCAEAGVFGVLPGVVGSVQATEVVKLILGVGTPLIGTLWLYDALTLSIDRFAAPRNPQCVCCGDTPSLTTIGIEEVACAVVNDSEELSVHAIQTRLQQLPRPFLLDVREPHEYDAGHLPGAVRIGVDALSQTLAAIPVDGDIIVYCRSGMRSARARDILVRSGRTAVSMRGGLLAWHNLLDPSITVV